MQSYTQFCATRKRVNYSYSVVGSKRPADLLKRPTKAELLAMVRRFEQDGELHNAIQLADQL